MRQQIAEPKRRQTDREKWNIAIDFKLLMDAGGPSVKFPLGKVFTRVCELENLMDW
ncbi:hypothetical protein HNQ71_003911 [Mesorhizobium sangaii]|uniref:Uncharacterized protein n=1 Tax=Mesorhizobium sangaii TaxID=505389 RepID=A0A841P7Q7_9HYPH|nr:hypothetical protein [Mesorhizobium sangaii]